MDTTLARYKDQVQAAQQTYSRTMAEYWKQVLAGGLSEAEYWGISNGDLLAECGARIAEATAEYDTARAPQDAATPNSSANTSDGT